MKLFKMFYKPVMTHMRVKESNKNVILFSITVDGETFDCVAEAASFDGKWFLPKIVATGKHLSFCKYSGISNAVTDLLNLGITEWKLETLSTITT